MEPKVPEWGGKYPNVHGLTGSIYETLKALGADQGIAGAGLRDVLGIPSPQNNLTQLPDWRELTPSQRKDLINEAMGYDITSPIPMVPLTYIGKSAKGWAGLSGKFSSMADKMQRGEISDFGAKLTLPEGEIVAKTRPLSETISHPELFKQYPQEIGDIKTRVKIEPNIGKPGFMGEDWLGGKYSKSGGIDVRAKTPEEAKGTLLHEIQHVVQEKEGFARGGSPVSAESKYITKLKQAYQWALKDKDMTAAKQLQTELQKASFDAYWKQAGEIEARDTALRANLTDIERANTPPYSIENIPLSEWITRGHGDKSSYREMKSIGDLFKKTASTTHPQIWVRQHPSGGFVAQSGVGAEGRIITSGETLEEVMGKAKAMSPGHDIKVLRGDSFTKEEAIGELKRRMNQKGAK